MSKQPTYTANEISEMCSKMDISKEAIDTLSDLLDEELELYTDQELDILMMAALTIFMRTSLKTHLGL